MKKESESIQLLNVVYQNAEKSIVNIDNIEAKIDSLEFKDVMKKNREEYKKICDAAIEIFIKYGKDEQAIGKIEKLRSQIMSNLATLKDNNISPVAKMLIEDINKSILELTEESNKYNDKDEEIASLVEKLIDTLKNNIDEIDPFL